MSKDSSKKTEKISIIPLADRVVLEEIDEKGEKTVSGIIIPGSVSSDRDTKKGKVVAVGEGKMVDGKLVKPSVREGDIVVYSWGENVTVGGKKYIIVGLESISAIIY